MSVGQTTSTTFHRPPREYPEAVPSEPLRVGAPPTEPVPAHSGLIQTLFPVVGGVGLVGFAIAFGNTTFLYIAGAMICLLLLFSIGMRWSQRRGVRKRAAAEARRYARYLRERDDELAEAGELQRHALGRLYPDPKKLWTDVLRRRGVWERRSNHPDFLHVRLGRGPVPLDREVTLDLGMNPLTEYQSHPLHEVQRMVERRTTLRNEPVVVDLSDVGVLCVTGSRELARGWARWQMLQLAASRAPQDLRIITSFDSADAPDWEWGKWLPHQRADVHGGREGPDLPMLTLARSPVELDSLLEAELRPRLEQIRRITESNLAGREVPLNAHELVVVIDGYRPDHPAAELPAVRELLTGARELNALLVLLVDDRELEPSEIDARLTVPEVGTGSWERSGRDSRRINQIAVDRVDLGTSEAIARALTPLRLEEGDGGERGLMTDVRLVDLLGLESASAIDPARTQAPRPRSRALRVPMGVGADGDLLELDLKQAAEGGMGPHGILVGATGSGKSELLRSLVAGLAVTHDPEALSFVLVDYKGGAAFSELARLPHVAGMITNLQDDLTLVDRMRDALVGEQERRQRMLREAGELDDVIAYQARRDGDPSLPPMPNLLVIVDEFAEMLTAKPDFIDLFVSLGRVGRSLGIHLLLSSQRLDEGRLRGLESHLRYRICLRTYSVPESKMVLGTPDAYLLPSLPGLGYLKVDTTVYTQFRAALASSPHREPSDADVPRVEVREFRGSAPAAEVAGGQGLVEQGERLDPERTDLEVLVERLLVGRESGEPVHQVWVPPLPAAQPLDAVLEGAPWWEAAGATGGLSVAIGTLDRPTEQRTEPLVLDFAGAGGHLAIVGAPRTGKSTVARTLITSLIWRYTPAEVRVYGIDLGGGGLKALAGAPHVGGVAGKLDREAVERVVRQLRAEIGDREESFRRLGIESIARVRSLRESRELPDGEDLADVFLVVDGWDGFRRDFEDLHREVDDIAASGLNFGVHVIVTTGRWAEIRPALLDNIGSRLELRLNDPVDSDVSRAAAASVPADTPGRGVTSTGHHFQISLPRLDGRCATEGSGEALDAIVREAAARWHGPPAEPIRLLPRRLSAEDLPPASPDGIAVGIEERTLRPVRVNLEGGDPHFLVFGDAETGKSSFLRLLARGIAESRTPEEAGLVIVDARRSLVEVAQLPHVMSYATAGPAVGDAIAQVARIAGERASGVAGGANGVTGATAWSGPRLYVIVDDYDLSAGSAGSPLLPLVDMLPVGRDIGLHVVLARRVGGSARGSFETVFQRLRELGSPGLILSGEPGEGPLLASQKAAAQPPGRGFLVLRGGRPLVIQTALATAAVEAPTPLGDGRGALAAATALRSSPAP